MHKKHKHNGKQIKSVNKMLVRVHDGVISKADETRQKERNHRLNPKTDSNAEHDSILVRTRVVIYQIDYDGYQRQNG